MILAKTLGISVRLGALIFVTLIMVTWPGCSSIPVQYKPFLELPEEKQRVEIRSYPIARQVELYLAAMRYIHPPPIGLANEIATGGKSIVPVLLSLLREKKDEDEQENIIYVLEVMHGCCYRLQDEKDLIAYLEEIRNTTKNENLQSRSEEALQYIVHGKMPDPIRPLKHARD